MSTETIKIGWLKDKNGDKFAPKTLSSQIQTADGVLLEDKIQDDLNATKAEILDSIAENIDLSEYETKEDAQLKLDEAKEYTDTQTSGLASTSTVETNIGTHNTSDSAHNDIRDLIAGLTTRINTLANSDDTTLDQMSEIVAYIKNNKDIIDGVTTSKVNVADIVNNLTTNVGNKPLSAAQGVALKGLIDALQTAFDEHTHGVADISGLQAALDGKAASDHGHDDKYYTKDEIDDYLNGKTQVQIITWGSDD